MAEEAAVVEEVAVAIEKGHHGYDGLLLRYKRTCLEISRHGGFSKGVTDQLLDQRTDGQNLI